MVLNEASREVGALWSEWGDMSHYGWNYIQHWTSEYTTFGSSDYYTVHLGNGVIYSWQSDVAAPNPVCRNDL